MSYKDLAGRTFIVTGAASGMGKATSKLLAQQGANVGIFDLQAPTATAQEIEAEGGHVLALACNVQIKKHVDDAVKQVAKHFGGLDGIPQTAVDTKPTANTEIGAANMAGIAATSRTAMGNFPMSTLDDADWDEMMKTNLDGVKNCLRAQLQNMTGPGSIVNAASTGGQYGPPNAIPYVASKWAVIGITKGTAKEEGKRGIRVNAVAPGVVDTPIARVLDPESAAILSTWVTTTALGRKAQPEEIARTILFLLSDASSFVTGSVVNVDGGYF